MKPGDLVMKVKGHSDKNKVGVVIEDLTVSPNGNVFVTVMVGEKKATWFVDYVEVINESR